MTNLTPQLVLPRCPHCVVATPLLNGVHHLETKDQEGGRVRKWRIYVCSRCGGVITAWAADLGHRVIEYFPSHASVDESIPDRPRAYLQQAQESLHAPSGAVMLSASAVDSMLKLKGYTDGSLYTRIEQAVADHLITAEMAAWAHEVRLDANDERHADHAVDMPTTEDAERVFEFASALAEFIFVLPSRIQRGLRDSAAQAVGD